MMEQKRRTIKQARKEMGLGIKGRMSWRSVRVKGCVQDDAGALKVHSVCVRMERTGNIFGCVWERKTLFRFGMGDVGRPSG